MFTHPSLWISLVSLVISIYAAYTTWKDKHRPIEITCNWSYKIGGQFNISFNFFNPSSRNASISKISIIENGHSYEMVREPLLLVSRAPKAAFSPQFPLNISPSTSVDAICPFQYLDSKMELKKYTLVFHVNGDSITKTIDLGKHILSVDQFSKVFESKLH